MIRKGCFIICAAAWLSLGVNWFVLDLLPRVTHYHYSQRQGMRELILTEPKLGEAILASTWAWLR